MVVTRASERGKGELVFNRCRVSVWKLRKFWRWIVVTQHCK